MAADVIVDAGAKRGPMLRLFLAATFPTARVICVEVDSGYLALLARQRGRIYPNIDVVPGGDLEPHHAPCHPENPEGTKAFAFG
jgi:hypothetical protein